MMTRYNIELSDRLVDNKIDCLIAQFYKILPIRESGEKTLRQYMTSLMREMLGMKDLITALNDDGRYLSVMSVLQYMIDHECDIPTTRCDVFKAIGILKKMQNKNNAVG